MNSTQLIVEYLVAGILTIVALLLAGLSFFPNEMLGVLAGQTFQETSLVAQIGLSTIFIAIAYALGIVVEYVGEKCFEWLLDKTKIKWMSKYLKKNKMLLEDSPILRSYTQQDPEKCDRDDLVECIGKMRFFVMNHSAPLYADIAAQISRFRLIRALFLIEVILAAAVVWQLIYQPMPLWRAAFFLIVAIAVVNCGAIYSRFGRYCRSVQRSYLILLQDQIAEQAQTKKEGTKPEPTRHRRREI